MQQPPRSEDVAQLVEHGTSRSLTQVWFPGVLGIFIFPQSHLSVQTLLMVSVTPCVESHTLTSVRTLKIL